jgi:hypothetical protein
VIVACAWCGQLTTDRETWHSPTQWVRSSVADHSLVSHGICPACFAKYLPERPAAADAA